MTDRGKRITFGKTDKFKGDNGQGSICCGCGCCCFLAVRPCSGHGGTGTGGGTIRPGDSDYPERGSPERDGEFQEPPDRYWDGDGKEYRLDYWGILTIPGQDAGRASGAEDGAIPVWKGLKGFPALFP